MRPYGPCFALMSEAEAVSRAMQRIARMVDAEIEKEAGQRIAFTLLVYTAPRASYVGSCERAEAIREMKRLIEIWEADMPDIAAHEVI